MGNPKRLESRIIHREKMKPEEYPENWNEIAFEIKAAANFECEHCGHPDDQPSGHVLTVHHLDTNKMNSDPSNLVALCQRCHLHFQNIDLATQGWLFGVPAWLEKRLSKI
jgi:5-methylcytosine-specific restriction endonuclease McrA